MSVCGFRLLGAVAVTFLAAACNGENPNASYTPADHPVVTSVVPAPPLEPKLMFIVMRTPLDNAMAREFQPRGDLPSWNIGRPVKWEEDPFKDRNWSFQLHALRPIDPLLHAYQETKDDIYLDPAIEIALDWVKSYPQHPPIEDLPEDVSMAWHDMATGLRALRLFYLHQAMTSRPGDFDPGQVALIEESLKAHADLLAEPEFFNPGNHGIFIAHGLMAACRALAEQSGCTEKRRYARDRMIGLIKSQYSPDGGHREHSPEYHNFVLRTLERTIASQWYQLDPADKATLTNARAAAPWMTDAYGNFPNVGDSERKPNKRRGELFDGTGICESEYALEADKCIVTKFFPDTGYAVLRTAPDVPDNEKTSLFMTCSHFSRKHKQDDELSFEWLENGVYILVDAGKYAYNRDDMRQYVLSRPAHNTLYPESGKRKVDPAGGCLTKQSNSGSVFTVAGKYQNGRGFSFERSLAYDVSSELKVVDRVSTKDTYLANWHFGPDVSLTPNGPNYTLQLKGEDFALMQITDKCDWSLIPATDEETNLGWYSPLYNTVQKVNTLQARCAGSVSRLETTFTLLN